MTITVLFYMCSTTADRLYNKVVKDDFKVEAECAAEDDYSSIIISKWLEDQYTGFKN